jgi:hypothetical protein
MTRLGRGRTKMADKKKKDTQVQRSEFMRDPARAMRVAERVQHVAICDSHGRVRAMLSAPAAPVFDVLDRDDD